MTDTSGFNCTSIQNLVVMDRSAVHLITVESSGATVFDWPAIRAFLEQSTLEADGTTRFVAQAVHAAYLEGIEKAAQSNAELAERCLKHADILTEDNWHTEAATLREAAAALVPKEQP